MYFSIFTLPCCSLKNGLLLLWNEWWPLAFTFTFTFFLWLFFKSKISIWAFKIPAKIQLIHRFLHRHHARCTIHHANGTCTQNKTNYKSHFHDFKMENSLNCIPKHLYFQFLIWFVFWLYNLRAHLRTFYTLCKLTDTSRIQAYTIFLYQYTYTYIDLLVFVR